MIGRQVFVFKWVYFGLRKNLILGVKRCRAGVSDKCTNWVQTIKSSVVSAQTCYSRSAACSPLLTSGAI